MEGINTVLKYRTPRGLFQPTQLRSPGQGKSTQLLPHQIELELRDWASTRIIKDRLLLSISSGNRVRLHVLAMLKQGGFGHFN